MLQKKIKTTSGLSHNPIAARVIYALNLLRLRSFVGFVMMRVIQFAAVRMLIDAVRAIRIIPWILVASASHSGNIDIILMDQNQRPITNAVVSFTGGGMSPSPVLNNTAVMDQVDRQFEPRVLVVQQGQQVQFPNSDRIRHHVYSFSETKPFEIKLYAGIPEKPIEFDSAGLVVLGCNIHDDMVGYIYVADTQYTAISNEAGHINMLGAQEYENVVIWHERLSFDENERLVLSRDEFEALKNSVDQYIVKIPLVVPAAQQVNRNGFGNSFRGDFP